ncbi:Hypothetical predicted protein [Mytilus galloprovincialis]|uniref:Uncharacterized protein n=2 Tax=Mytilus galloprovincialis TaxID=29158 RepID=A0A8B6D7L0_MYTGA|nr:Hypothetical predicted protein [Mytilus galloprovincialis]
MEISQKLNRLSKQNNVIALEKQLEKLKLQLNESNKSCDKILELENKIKEYYTKKTVSAKIRSRTKWAEDGEKSTKYFFNLEKKNGQNKLWQRVKTENGEYKCDIDSILNEQVKFYTKLFATEGWDKTAGEQLCQFMVDKVSKEKIKKC